MKSLPLLLALACAAALHAAPEPSTPPPASELGRAFVTIPYSELRALWEAGQAARRAAETPDALPPVAQLVHRAELVLTLGENRSALETKFEAESLTARWQTIPLLGGEARLEQTDAQVVWKDGYCLLASEAGRKTATLNFVTRGAAALTPQAPLRLVLGSATVKLLRVAGIPAGYEARVNGSTGEMKNGVASFALPSEAGEVTLQLAEPRVEKPSKPATPSQWQTQSQTLVRYAEGRLHFQSRVFAHADDGSGLELLLTLPANAAAVTAKGDDVEDWAALRLDDGRRVMRVRWKTADVLDREVAVTYTVPQSPLDEQWLLHAPSAPEHADARHLYVIVPPEGLELKGGALGAAAAANRLPQWMRELIDGAVFVTAEGGSQLALQTHWLPTIAAAEAIVTEAKGQLRLVSDGSSQTAMSYVIRHQTPLAWKLELPADVNILSCSINGRSARPIQREGGVIEFALPAPADAATGATQVALVYSAKVKPLDPVSGRVALELPRTPLFIERLDWLVGLPGEFEVTAAEGNVAIAPPAQPGADAGSIALRKDLCSGERPGVELFYQRRSLEK